MRALPTLLISGLVLAAALPIALPASATTTVSPVKAAAKPSGASADVRCLMTMLALGQDKTRAQAGQIGVYFFMGRINARAPGFDLAAAMKAEAPTLGGPALQAELTRCGPMVAGASQSLQGAINGLRPPGAPAPAAPAAAAPPVAPAAPAPK